MNVRIEQFLRNELIDKYKIVFISQMVSVKCKSIILIIMIIAVSYLILQVSLFHLRKCSNIVSPNQDQLLLLKQYQITTRETNEVQDDQKPSIQSSLYIKEGFDQKNETIKEQLINDNTEQIEQIGDSQFSMNMICFDDQSRTHITRQLTKYKQMQIFDLFIKYMQQMTQYVQEVDDIMKLRIIKDLNSRQFKQANIITQEQQENMRIQVQISNLQNKAYQYIFNIQPITTQYKQISENSQIIRQKNRQNALTDDEMNSSSVKNTQQLSFIPKVELQGNMEYISDLEQFNRNRLIFEFICSFQLDPIYSIQNVDQLYSYMMVIFSNNFKQLIKSKNAINQNNYLRMECFTNEVCDCRTLSIQVRNYLKRSLKFYQ